MRHVCMQDSTENLIIFIILQELGWTRNVRMGLLLLYVTSISILHKYCFLYKYILDG